MMELPPQTGAGGSWWRMDSPAEKHTLLGLNAIREPRNAHVYTSFQCPWHTATVPPAGFEHAHRSTGSKLAKEPGLCPRGASFCVACRRAAKMRCLRGACVSARSTTTERFVPASDRNTTQGLVESNHTSRSQRRPKRRRTPVPHQENLGWSCPQFTRVFAPPTTAASFSCSVSSL